MNSVLRHLLGQMTIRARIRMARVLLAAVLIVPIPLITGGHRRVMVQQEAVRVQFAQTERALLAVWAHLAASRAELLEYVDGRERVAGGALAEIEKGRVHLDAAAEVVPQNVLVEDATGSRRGLEGEIHNLGFGLDAYEELLGQMERARLADHSGDAERIADEALVAAEDLADTAVRLIAAAESARISASSAAQAEARAWMTRALVGVALGSVALLGLTAALAGSIARSVETLRAGAERLSAGATGGWAGAFGSAVPAPISLEGEDELAFVAEAVNKLSFNLARSHQLVEERVEERTALLRQHIRQLQATIESAQAAADLSTQSDASNRVIDLQVLLQQIVEVIQRRLGLYYVGLFLVDDVMPGDGAGPGGSGSASTRASLMGAGSVVLRAGTGEAGARMLAKGHGFSVGEGMIGWAVANGQARVALEVETDLVRVTNPDLPATRSEAAIPLRIMTDFESAVAVDVGSLGLGQLSRTRRTVIGALTVQDDRPGAFDEETMELLQVMADLLAVMIENARRYREVTTALESVHRSYGQETREGWMRIAERRSAGTGYLSTGSTDLAVTPEVWDPRMRQAVESQQVIETEGLLIVPIAARGQTIGAVRLQRSGAAAVRPASSGRLRSSRDRTSERHGGSASTDPDGSAAPSWSAKEIELVRTIVEQLGLALDSARLYEDTQNAAMLEGMIGGITSKVRAEVEIEAVLERALAELGQALGADRGSVFLSLGEPSVSFGDATSSGGERDTGGRVGSNGGTHTNGGEDADE
jgi:GAF domain-containing protein